MHLKEVTIDGFKSYAQRTVVPNFDPLFNAITGLNGSGKSNILDSICFVLGITNLSQVRAGNLQELVYKQGQAGVTKASVSLVFDNSDSGKSPVGYEQHTEITVTRQIVIGGRNKYLINGHVAQPNRVQNLFHSVQLNINNPHFLIMQGRITKVLNMKPPEILSMLEEASGTRMYENKKEAALKTLEKKQTKVDEIDRIQSEEILPALEKLRKERTAYNQWTAGNTDLDKLKRLVIAFEFSEAESIKNAALGEVEELKARIEELTVASGQKEEEIARHEKNISDLTAQRETSLSSGVQAISTQVDQVSALHVKETAVYKNRKDILDSECQSVTQLEANIRELESVIAEKEEALASAAKDGEQLKARETSCYQRLADVEKEHQYVLAGKTGAPGEDKSLAEKLSEAKAAAVAAGSDAKQARLKVQHLEKELVGKKKLLASKKKEALLVDKELHEKRVETEKREAALAALEFDPRRLAELEQVKEQESGILRSLKRRLDELSSQTSGLDFIFNDPVRGFDRSKVKGIVARLIQVRDPSATTALEVVAGGKMYNVIVDGEQTAKLLLEKGGLRRRVTLIPLNKIESRTIPQEVEAAAIRIGGVGNVQTALSCVDFDPQLRKAMEFVFGGVFICKDSQTAKRICFHNQIRTPCVTLEGDYFSPSGTLSGGSRNKNSSVLQKLHEMSLAEAEWADRRAVLEAAESELTSLAGMAKEHHRLTVELDLKQTELRHLQERVAQSEHHQLSEEVSAMELELGEAQAGGTAFEQKKLELEGQASSLEREIADMGREREKKLKALESKVKTAKAELAAATKALKAHAGVLEKLGMERDAVQQERALLSEQISGSEAQQAKLTKEVEELFKKLDERSVQLEALNAELKQKREEMKACDKEISSLSKAVDKLKKKLTDSNLEIKKAERSVQKMEAEREVCTKLVDRLLKEHEWIASEKRHFGLAGTDYDFNGQNPRESRKLLEEKKAEQAALEKRVNKKVVNMFEKAEQEYNDLLKKKNIIENDKAKIQQVIIELDEKKKEQLRVTWNKVNKDFGSIFSTLLPGTMAKLDPPEGCDFLAGLEVKVAFGTVWKQSLSELSGGQRSLLALSLILALLLFKPAPLYILDEVDAALDLSHTQNIGRMIKAHFPQSQFIVVSLKEGMFNNANVIFRTKFVDGVSTVTRTVPAAAVARQQEDQLKQAASKKGVSSSRQRQPLRENV